MGPDHAAAIREHLLSKYLQLFPVTRSSIRNAPFSYVLPHSLSSLRDALVTHVELLCLRLGVQGAFVVFIDGDTPYFLAGAQSPGSIESDPNVPETAGLLGSGKADIQQWLRIFRDTIAVKKAPPEQSILDIPSLTEDDRSAKISTVCGAPHLSFYAGTPMPIRQGVPIGAVFVVDYSRRNCITDNERKIFVECAERCMSQLETARQNAHYDRWKRMNVQMSNFVGSRAIREQQLEEPPSLGQKDQDTRREEELDTLKETAIRHDLDPSKVEDVEVLEDDFSKNPETKRLMSVEDKRDEEVIKAENAEQPRNKTGQLHRDTKRSNDQGETTYRKVFRRAAECIQEALQVDGVMFTDGLVGYHGAIQPMAETEEELERDLGQSPEVEDFPEKSWDDGPTIPGKAKPQEPIDTTSRANGSTRTYTSPEYLRGVRVERPAELLGMTARDQELLPECKQLSHTTQGLAKLDEAHLQLLMDQCPDGKVWYVQDGTCFQLRNEELEEETRDYTRRFIASIPGVRQVVFQPLTDPVSLKRLAGCFAWTTKPYPVFTDVTDLPSLRGFLHILESEIARVDASAAVKQKEAFVSSVSHELRTPLHGILGSVQLLADTQLDPFQIGLADTIKTSGSTLNETLTSVLAYAKINQFERQQHKFRERQPPDENWSLKKMSRPSGPDTDYQNLYIATNVATLCEEIAGVLEAGQSYDKSEEKGVVTVVLGIDFEDSWNYFTEPGALRRIAINIIGNALKYTTKGLVTITLEASKLDTGNAPLSPQNDTRRVITFKVRDTGKGMSKEFMDKHLFVPFTQEDTTSSQGVGLGMSIVKSLVSLLAGEIKVDSEQGKGTEITVTMPMRRHECDDEELEKPALDLHRNTAFLRAEHLSVVLFGFPPAVRRCLEKYCHEWFHCNILEGVDDAEPDIILVDEGNPDVADDVARTAERYGRSGILLSIAMVADTLSKPMQPIKGYRSWERIPRPIGPNNLGKALVSCVAKLKDLRKHRDAGTDNESDSHRSHDEARKHLGDIARSNSDEKTRGSNPSHVQIMPPPVPSKKRNDTKSEENKSPKPRQTSHERPLPIRSGSFATSYITTNPSRLRVLVVEDNAINRKILGAFLKKYGCQDITFAENGAIAVQNVEEKGDSRFDVIFMDLSMPVMNGFEATRRIRRIEHEHMSNSKSPPKSSPPPAYIVALTGLASDRDEDEAIKAGVDKFVTKPVNFDKLKGVLEVREEEAKKCNGGEGE